jgi:hypothetical protein
MPEDQDRPLGCGRERKGASARGMRKAFVRSPRAARDACGHGGALARRADAGGTKVGGRLGNGTRA